MIYITAGLKQLSHKALLIKSDIVISPDYIPKNFPITIENILKLAKLTVKLSKSSVTVNFSNLFNTVEDLKLIEKTLKQEEYTVLFEEITESILKLREKVSSNPADIKTLYSDYKQLKDYEIHRRTERSFQQS